MVNSKGSFVFSSNLNIQKLTQDMIQVLELRYSKIKFVKAIFKLSAVDLSGRGVLNTLLSARRHALTGFVEVNLGFQVAFVQISCPYD